MARLQGHREGLRGRLAGKAIAMAEIPTQQKELGKILAAFLCSSSMMAAATAMENFTLHSDVEAREVWLFLYRSQILPPAEGKVSQRRELCQNPCSTKPQLL